MLIRSMTLADLSAGMRLSGLAGWNQTETDWALFLREGECFAAKCEGRIVGTTGIIRYENRLAWIGLVLVDPEFRRQGIASRLMQHALEHLCDIPCIKLDASVDGKKVYDTLGFRDEHQIVRLTNPAVPVLEPDETVTLLTEITSILSLDTKIFDANRGPVLQEFLLASPQTAFRSERGYCLGRPGAKQYQIGPVIAKNTAQAQALIKSALHPLANKPAVLDVPTCHTELLAWLESLGFAPARVFQRMAFGKGNITEDVSQTFAIAGPEMG